MNRTFDMHCIKADPQAGICDTFIPPAATGAINNEVGWIGRPFTSTQLILTGTPTQVSLDTAYDAGFPLHPSFITDTAAFGFEIVTAGVYAVNYQLLITNNSLPNSNERYQASVQYTLPIVGTQIVAQDVRYGSTTATSQAGVVLIGQMVVALPVGAVLILVAEQNTGDDEDIIGPSTGPFIGAPDQYNSYMQLVRLL